MDVIVSALIQSKSGRWISLVSQSSGQRLIFPLLELSSEKLISTDRQMTLTILSPCCWQAKHYLIKSHILRVSKQGHFSRRDECAVTQLWQVTNSNQMKKKPNTALRANTFPPFLFMEMSHMKALTQIFYISLNLIRVYLFFCMNVSTLPRINSGIYLPPCLPNYSNILVIKWKQMIIL